MEKRMKKEKSLNLQAIIVILALFLFGYTLMYTVMESFQFTGGATAQTATVQLFVVDMNITINDSVGGKGGSGGLGKADFSFSAAPSVFSFDSFVMVDSVETLLIKNTGDLTLNFEVDSNSDFIQVSESRFKLPPKKDKPIIISFSSGGDGGIKTGVIRIRTEFSVMYIPVIIDVKTEGADFDVDLYIPPEFRVVEPFGEIFYKVYVGGLEGGMVDIKHVIVNAESDIIYEVRQHKKVIDEITLDRTMKMPDFLNEGTYVLGVVVGYKGETQVDSELFTIRKDGRSPTLEQPRELKKGRVFVLLIICFILVHVFIVRKNRIRFLG